MQPEDATDPEGQQYDWASKVWGSGAGLLALV